jgi:hypothetical protein
VREKISSLVSTVTRHVKFKSRADREFISHTSGAVLNDEKQVSFDSRRRFLRLMGYVTASFIGWRVAAEFGKVKPNDGPDILFNQNKDALQTLNENPLILLNQCLSIASRIGTHPLETEVQFHGKPLAELQREMEKTLIQLGEINSYKHNIVRTRIGSVDKQSKSSWKEAFAHLGKTDTSMQVVTYSSTKDIGNPVAIQSVDQTNWQNFVRSISTEKFADFAKDLFASSFEYSRTVRIPYSLLEPGFPTNEPSHSVVADANVYLRVESYYDQPRFVVDITFKASTEIIVNGNWEEVGTSFIRSYSIWQDGFVRVDHRTDPNTNHIGLDLIKSIPQWDELLTQLISCELQWENKSGIKVIPNEIRNMQPAPLSQG